VSYRKNLVGSYATPSSRDRALTVGLSRAHVHEWGTNWPWGYDGWQWLFNWIGRLLTRDHAWRVTIRQGVPQLWSGVQLLLWSRETARREEAEQVKALVMQALKEGWRPASLDEQVPTEGDRREGLG
jgi:hypothetical protein